MPLTAIILAAGEGKRMRSELPKVLHLIGGKPMLVRILESVQTVSPEKIIVVTGKYHYQIIQTLSKWMDIFGIIFVEQSLPLGTGHAVLCCIDQFTKNDRVLILNGDMPLIRPAILRIIVSPERENKVMTTRFENPTGYGRIIYDNRGDFRGIIEECNCREHERLLTEVNTEVYVLSGKILHECLPLLTNNNCQKEYYFTDVINHALSAGYKIHTYMTKDSKSTRGANTPEELVELENLL